MVSAFVSGLMMAIAAQSVDAVVIHRELAADSGCLRTIALRNDLAGRTLRVSGPEFVMTYGTGQPLTSDAFEVKSLERTPEGARAVLELADQRLRAEISYAVGKGPWLYKQIVLTNLGTEPFLLRSIDVEHLTVVDEAVTYAVDPKLPALGDWGQPV